MAPEINEICLLWGDWQIQKWWSCMEKNEWAAWAQFFGAVLAIYGASRIAARQFINSVIVNEEGAARQLMQFSGQIDLFFNNWSKVGNAIESRYLNAGSLENFRLVLQENLDVARGVSLEHLSAEWCAACVFSRSTAVQVICSIQRMEKCAYDFEEASKIRMDKFASEQDYFSHLDAMTKKYQDDLRKQYLNIMSFKGKFKEIFDEMKKSMDKKSRFSSPADMKMHFTRSKVR